MTKSITYIEQLVVASLLEPNDQKRIVEADNAERQHSSPWYIGVLIAICGWLAACFGLGFFAFFSADLFDSPIGLISLGAGLILCAYLLLANAARKVLPHNNGVEFMQHVALALSINGQLLITAAVFFVDGLFSKETNASTVDIIQWFCVLLMHIVLALKMPFNLHRLLSAYAAAFSFSFLFIELSLFGFSLWHLVTPLLTLLVGLLWLKEYSLSRYITRTRSLAYGVTLFVLQANATLLYMNLSPEVEQDLLPNYQFYVTEILNMLVVLFLLYSLIKQYPVLSRVFPPAFSIVCTLLVLLLTYHVIGIATSIILLLIAFSGRNKLLLSMAIVSALVNLSGFYYWLDMSLLHKSFLLFGIGTMALCLLGGLHFYRKENSLVQTNE